MVKTVPSLAMLRDEMSAAEQAEMLGNGGTGDGEGLRDTAGGLTSLPQEIEHGAAGGVGEGAKGGLRRICNRTVTHYV